MFKGPAHVKILKPKDYKNSVKSCFLKSLYEKSLNRLKYAQKASETDFLPHKQMPLTVMYRFRPFLTRLLSLTCSEWFLHDSKARSIIWSTSSSSLWHCYYKFLLSERVKTWFLHEIDIVLHLIGQLLRHFTFARIAILWDVDRNCLFVSILIRLRVCEVTMSRSFIFKRRAFLDPSHETPTFCIQNC